MCKDILNVGRIKVLRFSMMGELFLHKQAVEFISLAKKFDIADRIEVTTNGSVITQKIANKIIEAGLDYIRVSIYSMYQEKHEYLTGSKLKIEKIYENIKYLYKRKRLLRSEEPFIYIKMIDNQNDSEKKYFFDRYEPICDEIFIEEAHNWESEENDYFGFFENSDKYYNRINKLKYVCPFPFYKLIVHSNADVTTCCVDWSRKTKIGNLKENNIVDIWHGKPLQNFRLMHLMRKKENNPACANCNFYKINSYCSDDIDNIKEEQFYEVGK